MTLKNRSRVTHQPYQPPSLSPFCKLALLYGRSHLSLTCTVSSTQRFHVTVTIDLLVRTLVVYSIQWLLLLGCVNCRLQLISTNPFANSTTCTSFINRLTVDLFSNKELLNLYETNTNRSNTLNTHISVLLLYISRYVKFALIYFANIHMKKLYMIAVPLMTAEGFCFPYHCSDCF